jgi:iron complex transport system substrate-binding protein
LTLEEVMASINTLGEMTGHVEEARALTGRIETRLKVDEPKEGPRVLVLIGLSAFEGGSLWYIKRSSLHGAAMHAAGAINAVSDEGSGAPSLSVEALLRIDPDIIITMVSQAELTEADRDAHIERLSRMNMLTAVKNQKLGFLVGEHCMSTGPSILRLADELAAELERLSGDS